MSSGNNVDSLVYCLIQVNATGAKVLEFVSDYGNIGAPVPSAIVACVPTKMHVDGFGDTMFNVHPQEIEDAIKAGLQEPIQAELEVCAIKVLLSLEFLSHGHAFHLLNILIDNPCSIMKWSCKQYFCKESIALIV